LALSFFGTFTASRFFENPHFDLPAEIARSSGTSSDAPNFTRNVAHVNFDNIPFTPWDVAEASENIPARSVKPYTIMIYMNGSDLESEHGAATDDLIEMLESGLKSEYANIIIFTGGSKVWQNDLIPEYDCVIWEVADGEIHELVRIGLHNMMDAGTLSGFIDFSMHNFPADKYGLVLWDHGGGSISGYGHDELFGDDNMPLLDFNLALEKSKVADTRLEFIGFDTCLLGSVEMAVIAADYANYMIASEDLIPGDGWDYGFLSVLNDEPNMDGAALGKAITDYFMDFYGARYFDELNMSVVDLNYAKHVMYALGALMEQGGLSFEAYSPDAFKSLAKRRSATKTFGEGSPRDNESDMVDIAHMAQMLADLFPQEAAALHDAIGKAVIYNRNNSDVALGGMSTFYLYGGKRSADASLRTYAGLEMDARYTQFLHDFSGILLEGRPESLGNIDIVQRDLTIWRSKTQSLDEFIMIGINDDASRDFDEQKWPKIGDYHVCMYKTNTSSRGNFYAIPSHVNGIDCDLIVLINNEFPNGKILGTRNKNGHVSQKGYIAVESGDRVGFYYQKWSGGWYRDDGFVVESELEMEWGSLMGEDVYKSERSVGVWGDCCFGKLIEGCEWF